LKRDRLRHALGRAALGALVVCVLWAAGPAGSQAGPAGRGVPVLMYHRVDPRLSARDPITVSLTVMTPVFESQLRLLREAGYESAPLAAVRDALDHRAPLPPRQVILTFDDGYEDNYTVVFPLLRRYGFTAVFFVVTSAVGTRDHLTVSQIREMAGAGMEIESHGVHHVDFSVLQPDVARRELVESRKAIEGWTGRPVTFFAYPAGRYNEALEHLLDTLGYRGALTTRYGFVSLDGRPFALPRVRITHDDTLASFGHKLGLSLP
jgi:peptidoglycan/xylan/chitin deacetylase (PgdA/CDA1 family)